MKRNASMIRLLAASSAVAIVAGAMLTLGNYSDAKFELAAAAAQRPYAAESVWLAIEPSRVDVVATRVARTRTAGQLDPPALRPQS